MVVNVHPGQGLGTPPVPPPPPVPPVPPPVPPPPPIGVPNVGSCMTTSFWLTPYDVYSPLKNATASPPA